jgi:hypothetical protein
MSTYTARSALQSSFIPHHSHSHSRFSFPFSIPIPILILPHSQLAGSPRSRSSLPHCHCALCLNSQLTVGELRIDLHLHGADISSPAPQLATATAAAPRTTRGDPRQPRASCAARGTPHAPAARAMYMYSRLGTGTAGECQQQRAASSRAYPPVADHCQLSSERHEERRSARRTAGSTTY